MKSTGIVRHIDNLGRIVIPKEIRSTLRIKNNDTLEVYLEGEKVILTKFSSLENLISLSQVFAETIATNLKMSVVITDSDKFLFTSSKVDNGIVNKYLPKKLQDALIERRIIDDIYDADYITTKKQYENILVVPIISKGDILGSIIGLSDEIITKEEQKIFKIATEILGNL